MGLEVFDFIPDLVDTNPVGATDFVNEGDDHLRGLKFTLQRQFPNIGQNEMTRSALQLNDAGLQSEVNLWTAQNQWTVPLLGPDGDAVTPAYNFTNRDAGMYASAGDRLNWATAGVQRAFLDASQFRSQVPMTLIDGSEAAPSYAFANHLDMGMFRGSPDSLGFAASGVLGMSIRATGNAGIFSGVGVAFQADGLLGAAKPAYTFSNDANTGMYRGGAGLLDFAVNAVHQFTISAAAIVAKPSILGRDGSLTNPSYAFENQANSGMFRPAPDQLALVTQGLEALRIDSGQQTTVRKESTVQRNNDTQARTGWRYTQANGVPMWAIYAGTSPTNTLAFQRYNDAGAFQDIPLSIRQLNGLIRMSTLPTSDAGLIAGELWRNPVSPGFIAIV